MFLKKLNEFSKNNNLSLFESLKSFLEIEKLTKSNAKNIKSFLVIFEKHSLMLKK